MASNSMMPSISPAPMGLSDLGMDDGPAIEIEIEDPQGLKVGVDGVEIDLMPDTGEAGEDEFDDNLAEYIDESELGKIGSEITALIEADITSRKDWTDMFVRGLEVLGMRYEERTEPWNGACGVYSTILTEAAVRFQSETIIETFPPLAQSRPKLLVRWIKPKKTRLSVFVMT